ncbi:type II toxin-antitoxin system Phd/YefM family antitoxin [Jannaschia sp. LMIT008]|uniref:type II toxin-antitoxin system Phd/YefM family antitoxin n=1 Tax=Jannaschia maritima TaxID=3032585 RepID=UPI002811A221|nr:type II toxin-antitoxin system Phd/YefM family antitoxin [Jannaschia sp. LMIT008]
MGMVVKVGEAKARLSELLNLVEAGEDVVIARGDVPVARLEALRPSEDVRAVIEEIREARKGLPRVTQDEIRAWRNEGRA